MDQTADRRADTQREHQDMEPIAQHASRPRIAVKQSRFAMSRVEIANRPPTGDARGKRATGEAVALDLTGNCQRTGRFGIDSGQKSRDAYRDCVQFVAVLGPET